MTRQQKKPVWMLYIFALCLLVAACGTTSSNSNRNSRPAKKSKSTKPVSHSNDKKGTDGKVAKVTEAVTKKKLGSWNLTADKVKDVSRLVSKGARDNQIPENLIYGIIWVESRFNPDAKSPVGAMGLMQLMPKTADYLAECISWKGRHDAHDPDFNIAAGSYYIARLIKQFDGDVELALAAYNAGPTKIRRWMASDGLPKVSIEYHTMVQTARSYFGGSVESIGARSGGDQNANTVPTTDDLDRLGLAILIAGLSDREFGLERTDDPTPFN